MFIETVSAAIQNNNLPKPQETSNMGSTLSSIQLVLTWLAVFAGIIGVVLLIVALFWYLVGASEEPKMQTAHNVLVGAIFCIIGAIILYMIGIWVG